QETPILWIQVQPVKRCPSLSLGRGNTYTLDSGQETPILWIQVQPVKRCPSLSLGRGNTYILDSDKTCQEYPT
ncbi:8821_t:CDS:2, partial [Gigaspora rosea]